MSIFQPAATFLKIKRTIRKSENDERKDKVL